MARHNRDNSLIAGWERFVERKRPKLEKTTSSQLYLHADEEVHGDEEIGLCTLRCER
jgi:hypothetical protein